MRRARIARNQLHFSELFSPDPAAPTEWLELSFAIFTRATAGKIKAPPEATRGARRERILGWIGLGGCISLCYAGHALFMWAQQRFPDAKRSSSFG